MEFVCAHRALKLRTLNDLAHKCVGIEQHVVVEKDVVNPDDAFLAKMHVIKERRACVELHSETVVQIMVKVRAGTDDPVHKARFHQRNDGRLAKARRSECAGERHADRGIAGDHLLREESASLREASAVVCFKRVIHELRNAQAFADGVWKKTWKFFVQRHAARFREHSAQVQGFRFNRTTRPRDRMRGRQS